MLEYTKLSTEAHQMQDATIGSYSAQTRVALDRIQWHMKMHPIYIVDNVAAAFSK